MGREAREQLTVGSLFSGIGGFDLGFERAGMRTVWMCEQHPYRREVLAEHWPDVPCYQDIKLITEPTPVDLICGGFPCQDISLSGRGAGIRGERSSLWFEFHRVIRAVRPRYVVVENSSALLRRGMDVVLGCLSESGYDAEWECLPASAFGAPHQRDRIWIVAYLQDSYEAGREGIWEAAHPGLRGGRVDGAESPVCDPGEAGRQRAAFQSESFATYRRWWEVEPAVGRVVDGLPSRVDRVAALGDSLVPQIAEYLGRRIINFNELPTLSQPC